MELQIFKNLEFGQIRVIEKNGEPWFVAKDICDILELTNSTVAMQRLDADEVTKLNLGGLAGEVNMVNEYGLYSLVLGSRKAEAKQFKRWITHDVIPSIRKHGSYSVVPQTFAEALRLAADQQEKIETLKLEQAQSKQIINELQPKATYYDLILQNKSLLSVTQIAKDFGLSATALNAKLHGLGIQYKQSDTWLLYQRFADRGYTQSKTHNIEGHEQAKLHTYWTQKGRLFIYEQLKSIGILPMIERDDVA